MHRFSEFIRRWPCEGFETLTAEEKRCLVEISPMLSDKNRRKDARRLARGLQPYSWMKVQRVTDETV